MVEPGSDFPGEFLIRHEVIPVQQQIVIVESLTMLLSRYIVPKQLPQLCLPVVAPGIRFIQHVEQRLLGVDTA